jgi:hypothetical protein
MELLLDHAIVLPAVPRWRQKLDDFIRWAGSKSFYLSKKVIEEYFGGFAFSAPSNVYLALLTVVPDDTSTGATITESDYTSYARTQIGTGNNQTDAWNAATGTTTATVTNKNAISGPTATGPSTNPIVAVAVLDSGTLGAGNILGWATVTSTAIASGDTPKINAGALSVVED